MKTTFLDFEQPIAERRPRAVEEALARVLVHRPQGVLAVLDHNLTYANIAEHSVRRWNLNSNGVNSKKII